ncbi:hypothetical protein Leryth_010081 [Lithospermum erythrorhizon]|nr:hypothetical protein Leryth_010081 [Lithospermum erythrorhizon]
MSLTISSPIYQPLSGSMSLLPKPYLYTLLMLIPTLFNSLQMLKSLDVSYNSISAIPQQIGSALALVKFDCSNNQLTHLPSSLGSCVNLAELKASNNRISILPEDLSNCSKLMKADLQGNKLEMLSENIIAAWTMLTELNACKIPILHIFLYLSRASSPISGQLVHI